MDRPNAERRARAERPLSPQIAHPRATEARLCGTRSPISESLAVGTPKQPITGQDAAESLAIRYFDIAWMSRHDGPGHRVVLYLQGCHLRCKWCHSPHSWPALSPLLFFATRCRLCGRCEQACPNSVHKVSSERHVLSRELCIGCGGCLEACPLSSRDHPGGPLALPTRELAVGDLWALLWPQLALLRDIGGITFGGGEALLQSQALRLLLGLCHDAGIHTAVETSGTLPPRHFSEVIDLVSTWLFGLRPTPHYLPPGSGHIEDNLTVLASSDSHVIVRTPLVSGITDQPESLDRIASTMQMYGLLEIELLPFHAGTFHYYDALGVPCSVGHEAIPSAGRLGAVRDFFVNRGFETRIID